MHLHRFSLFEVALRECCFLEDHFVMLSPTQQVLGCQINDLMSTCHTAGRVWGRSPATALLLPRESFKWSRRLRPTYFVPSGWQWDYGLMCSLGACWCVWWLMAVPTNPGLHTGKAMQLALHECVHHKWDESCKPSCQVPSHVYMQAVLTWHDASGKLIQIDWKVVSEHFELVVSL